MRHILLFVKWKLDELEGGVIRTLEVPDGKMRPSRL